jgi:hypothetical protein
MDYGYTETHTEMNRGNNYTVGRRRSPYGISKKQTDSTSVRMRWHAFYTNVFTVAL